MPDYMDQLVDAQTENEMADLKAAAKQSSLDDEDRALMEEGAMTKAAAEEVTEAIKSYATATWVLVKRAHDGKAWKSLGYSTWADYVKTEFDMSTSRSYQLINQAKVIAALEDAAPSGTKLLLTEAQTRDIKQQLPRITEKVKKETVGDDPAMAASKINDMVQKEREAIHNDLDGVQEDSFQDLDAKGSAPEEDKLNASDSGSASGGPITTGVEDLDLDAEIPSGDDGDMGDGDLYAPTEVGEAETDLLYLLQYYDRLAGETSAQDLAKVYKDDVDHLRGKCDEIIKFFTDLRRLVG